MLLIKTPPVVVLFFFLAASRRALAVPNYPRSAPITSDTSTAQSGNQNSQSGLQAGLGRIWEGMTCMSDCRITWGWAGNHFGGDPWGGVLQGGDPMPYVSNSNADTSANPSENATATTSTDSDGGFGILDVTTTTQTGSSAVLSAFNVLTLTGWVKDLAPDAETDLFPSCLDLESPLLHPPRQHPRQPRR